MNSEHSACTQYKVGEDVDSSICSHKIIWLRKNCQSKFQLYNMALQYKYTFKFHFGKSLLVDFLGQIHG